MDRNRLQRLVGAVLAVACAASLGVVGLVFAAGRGPRREADCSPGARTLSRPGTVLYPEVGNGGYRSVHTDVDLRYDADRNRFLRGTRVTQTVRATQCLSALSFDFERFVQGNPPDSPHLRVDAITVDGQPARFRFIQPTYPGDPRGPEDPDPRAHEASQHDPVGGPDHNPLPPACSPELIGGEGPDSRDGTQCPADGLVITPRQPIPAGTVAHVAISYSGTPGAHRTGEGSITGWMRTRGGNSMSSEPLGTEDWMPSNEVPSAKPTYDFTVTTQRGKTVIANGERSGIEQNPPSKEFPRGSATTSWDAPFPIASYLPLTIVGDYSLRQRMVDGIRYYQAIDRHIGARRRARDRAVMDHQPSITRFESRFNGPYPFPSDGVVAGVPGSSGDIEEMQTMIVFSGGKERDGYVDQASLYHETMHQWWGDSVSEATYGMAFFKEGLATLSEKLAPARRARRHGGNAAFERELRAEFDETYERGPDFWSPAPSATEPYTYLDAHAVYQRPGAAYIALRAILGARRFDQVLHDIQRRYGGASIDEPQLEVAFTRRLPDPSPTCRARLRRFLGEWFDTAYPQDGAQRPRITGPGLAGADFYADGCRR